MKTYRLANPVVTYRLSGHDCETVEAWLRRTAKGPPDSGIDGCSKTVAVRWAAALQCVREAVHPYLRLLGDSIHDAQTWQEVTERLTQVLAPIVTEFNWPPIQVTCDATTNPPDVVEMNELRLTLVFPVPDAGPNETYVMDVTVGPYKLEQTDEAP